MTCSLLVGIGCQVPAPREPMGAIEYCLPGTPGLVDRALHILVDTREELGNYLVVFCGQVP